MSFRVTAMLILLSAFTYAGCAAFRVPEEPPTPTPVAPAWSDDELDDHLDFLNRTDAAERTTGTTGYAQAAAYVAARLREFRLQPAIGDDFRVVYSAAMNYPISGALRTVAREDSASYYLGADFLPHGQSDSGSVSVQLLVVTGDTAGIAAPPKGPFGVLFRDGEVGGSAMRAWRDAGAVLAIIVEPPKPRYFSERIRRLVVIQLAPQAAERLIPMYGLASEHGEAFELSRRIVAYVHSDFQPNAGAVNILGLISGKHPQLARDAVLVCTDLDAIGGSYAGVETVDYRNFGMGTAALLELARNLSFVSRRWLVPERSILMAVWSGSQLGHEGLREFLARPTWALSRIVSVIYVGLDPEEEPAVRRLLQERGLDLHVIPSAAPPLFDPPLVLLPKSPARLPGRERIGVGDAADEQDPYDLPDIDDVVELAISQSRDLAAAAFERILLESTDARPFWPASEDTLEVPSAEGVE